MSITESEMALEAIVKKSRQTWGEERLRNLGATVDALMQRRGFDPNSLDDEFADLKQEDFELAA